MTCIVAIASEGIVYIGGDRGYSDGDIIASACSPKIFHMGSYVLGFAGNAGLGQNVVHTFDAPTHRVNTDTYKYIYKYFIPSLRDHLKDYLSDKEENQASFILGYRGKIFEIDTADFQCVEYYELAIGSGSAYAYGSLYSTYKNPLYEGVYTYTPEERVALAVESAIRYSPTCLGPIDTLYI